MSNFVVLGCLAVGEKFPGGWGHFHSKNLVTPTLGYVRLGCNNKAD